MLALFVEHYLIFASKIILGTLATWKKTHRTQSIEV